MRRSDFRLSFGEFAVDTEEAARGGQIRVVVTVPEISTVTDTLRDSASGPTYVEKYVLVQRCVALGCCTGENSC